MKDLNFIEWIKQNPAIEKLYVIFATETESDPYWLFSPTPSTYCRRFITGERELQYDVTMAHVAAISRQSVDLALTQGHADSNETIKALFDTQALIDWVEEQNRNRNYPAFHGCTVEKVEAMTGAELPSAVGADRGKFTLTIRVTYTTY